MALTSRMIGVVSVGLRNSLIWAELGGLNLRSRLIFMSACAILALTGLQVVAQPVGNAPPVQASAEKFYEADKAVVFGAAADALQDLGFNISSADLASGLIISQTDTVNKTSFLDALGRQTVTGNSKLSVLIETFPDGKTRLKIRLVETKEMGAFGPQLQSTRPINDNGLYARLIGRIDAGVLARLGHSPNLVATKTPMTITPVADLGPVASGPYAMDDRAALEAVQDELTSEGFQVLKMDLTDGSLITGPKEERLTPAKVDCGKMLGIPFILDKRASTQLQYFVQLKAGVAHVRTAIDGVYRAGYGNQDRTLKCTSRGVVEAALLAKIAGNSVAGQTR